MATILCHFYSHILCVLRPIRLCVIRIKYALFWLVLGCSRLCFAQWHCALGGLFCPVYVKHVCKITYVSIIKWGQFGREITVLPILHGFVFVAGFFRGRKFFLPLVEDCVWIPGFQGKLQENVYLCWCDGGGVWPCWRLVPSSVCSRVLSE